MKIQIFVNANFNEGIYMRKVKDEIRWAVTVIMLFIALGGILIICDSKGTNKRFEMSKVR